MKISKLCALAGTVALSGAAFGQTWNEIPDAGGLAPGQATVGVGILAHIVGELTGAGFVVEDYEDAYCIQITDPANFLASTSAANGGAASFDTQLFLFDMNGVGIVHNDDTAPGNVGLQSTITSLFTANLQPGMYMLAISGYNNDPLNAAGSAIWANSPFGAERTPDGPGAPGPVAGWSSTTGAIGTYDIILRGASFCEVPTPGALALLGMGGLLVGRRRR